MEFNSTDSEQSSSSENDYDYDSEDDYSDDDMSSEELEELVTRQQRQTAAPRHSAQKGKDQVKDAGQRHQKRQKSLHARNGMEDGLKRENKDYYDEDEYSDEGDDSYYDDEDEDEYYDDEDEDQYEEMPNQYSAPVKQELTIDVTISEMKKNAVLEVPITHEADIHHKETIPKKIDNDMESSDISFSEEANQIDEHSYQIGELGQFEVEKSVSDAIEGINEDRSVDFSDGDQLSADISDLQDFSHGAVNEYS